VTAATRVSLAANRSLSPKWLWSRASHIERKCKCVERLRLCRCWGGSDCSRVPVTVRLAPLCKFGSETRSPWHSGACLPPCRRKAPRGASGSMGGAPSDWATEDRRRRQRRLRGRNARQAAERRSAALRSGTPGSDHFVTLGKARRMPNTSTRPMCRCHVSGIDLTLAGWIGRFWTRPGRGNISLSAREGQFHRAGECPNLCVFRRLGRATTHTFRAFDPQVGPQSPRDVRRVPFGAR
jgi:hypothetical protein